MSHRLLSPSKWRTSPLQLPPPQPPLSPPTETQPSTGPYGPCSVSPPPRCSLRFLPFNPLNTQQVDKVAADEWTLANKASVAVSRKTTRSQKLHTALEIKNEKLYFIYCCLFVNLTYDSICVFQWGTSRMKPQRSSSKTYFLKWDSLSASGESQRSFIQTFNITCIPLCSPHVVPVDTRLSVHQVHKALSIITIHFIYTAPLIHQVLYSKMT